ncbi:MAG: hypothetical protein U0821_18510 [Chloroflexota bacterium]
MHVHPQTTTRVRAPGWSVLRKHAAWVIFIVSLAVLTAEAAGAPFEGDESDYIATSRYFGYLLRGELNRPEWAANHWTRTQPPLTRYIIGSWLTLRGYDLEQLNQPYVSTARSVDANRRRGRVPEDAVLHEARVPMVVLAAVGIAAIASVAGALAGPLAAVTAGALALSSPIVRYTLVHAWAEAPLFCLMAVSLALASHPSCQRGAIGRSSLLGISLGAASAVKLTGLVGLAATGAALLTDPLRTRAHAALPGAAVAAAVVLVFGATFFLGVNPYLWPDPAGGFVGMLEERATEMAEQQRQWPEFAVTDPFTRPWLTVRGALQFGPWADTPLAVPIGGVLVLAGGYAILRPGSSTTDDARHAGWMLAWWVACYAIAITAGLGLSYPRYFMPLCLLLIPVAAIGAVKVVSATVAVSRRPDPR